MKSLQDRYGEFFNESPLVEFNAGDVPENLQSLVPYARFWGIQDDWQREQLVTKAPASIRESLRTLIAEYEDVLDDWLAGEEATSSNPSDAYIAFSAMRMCADFM
jgi:hypothetical protein